MVKLTTKGGDTSFYAPGATALLSVVRDICGMTRSRLGSGIAQRDACAVDADGSLGASKLSAGAMLDRGVTLIEGIGKAAHRSRPRSSALDGPRGACETRDGRNLSVEESTVKTIASRF